MKAGTNGREWMPLLVPMAIMVLYLGFRGIWNFGEIWDMARTAVANSVLILLIFGVWKRYRETAVLPILCILVSGAWMGHWNRAAVLVGSFSLEVGPGAWLLRELCQASCRGIGGFGVAVRCPIQ